ncbi:hypothetical protein SteCoe_32665 [Stentor coeruleus]|uniref:Uncharacterized protein n=1 Tax=Stentor coeruleus TaxID=5963 RepID=A0A1R2AYJ1_9CILI|nr:hypothetical protein SteCoe_32665 [Stentor coeruleus]
MQVAIEKKIEWDDDDPYQIPDSHLPKIKEGEIIDISEKPEKAHSKNSDKHTEIPKPEENPVQAFPDSTKVQEQEKTEKKHKKSHKNKEKSADTQQVTNENDPLRATSSNQKKAVEVEEPLYPSMYEIVKHVDEEKEKIKPADNKEQEEAPKHKNHNREGHASCKKCIIQ